ncbi:MAG TPA: DNA alkylation repair protein [Anaerolineaceae bacterium]|jgi:3-methyladenine DNA glycosylase AlkD
MAYPKLSFEEMMEQLQALADPAALESQKRFGITAAAPLGISMPRLLQLSRGQRDHELARQLWQTGFHEARILASLVDELPLVTRAQMERWVLDFDSWDVCDQVCGNLFDRTPFAVDLALEWPARPQGEFVRRAGFVLMAGLARHDKGLPDSEFVKFFPLIVTYATDQRNFVKKAVNWALRGIGKRNPVLRSKAIATAQQIKATYGSPTARWIANDALRELEKKQT